MSGSPAACTSVGSQSCDPTISLLTELGSTMPGHRSNSGTRNAPSQLVFFSLRNQVVPASGSVLRCGPLSVEKDDDRVVGDPQLVELVEDLADLLAEFDHRVVVLRLPQSGLPADLVADLSVGVHAGEVLPDEERCVVPLPNVR